MPELVARLEQSDDRNSDSSDSEYESGTESPLVNKRKVVELLPGSHLTLSAQAAEVDGPETGELKALATLPLELTVTLPEDYKPGSAVKAVGPHGEIPVMPPPDAQPGSKHTFKLGVPPDMKVTVPNNFRKGRPMMFKRSDGLMVSVDVPEGKGPGDSFTVVPPSLLVKVPDAANPGDVLVFKNAEIRDAPKWLRVQLPENFSKAGSSGYVGVRVPFEFIRQADAKTEH